MRKPIPLPLLLFTIFIVHTALSVSGQAWDEYAVKSSIVYRICKYTQWSQPPDKNKLFTISILGKTTHGKEIIIPGDATIDKRKIVVRKIRRLSEIDGSEVLFITSAEAYRIDDILDYIGNKPVLTIGDTRGFAQKGVIINLYIHQNSVGFEINYGASKKASLQMHSQLFTIGRMVKTGKSLKKGGEK